MALPQPNAGSDWTVETLRQYVVEMMANTSRVTELQATHARALHDANRRFLDERDRRYAEVALEREKALKIKETADLAALSLAREIQTYKDEKANNLRSQIEGERGNYATKSDLKGSVDRLEALIQPLAQYVAAEQGRIGGRADSTRNLVTIIGLVLTAVTVVVGVYLATRR